MTDEEGEIIKSEISRLQAEIHNLLCQLDQLRSTIPVFRPFDDNDGGGGATGTITYLGDVTWDTSAHTLVKHWETMDLATGDVTSASTPSGKDATIPTTAISSIIGS